VIEIPLIIGLLLLERLRLDLYLRRWWARVGPGMPAASGMRVPVPLALAAFDARRLVPRVLTVLVAALVLRSLLVAAPVYTFGGVNQSIGQYWAFAGLLVLVLVASVGGRDRDVEGLAALPCGPRTRVLGTAVILLLAALAVYALSVLRLHRVSGAGYDNLLPDRWELAQPALLVLGGGLLGLLVARLLPVWAAVPVGAVGAVLWTGVVGGVDNWPMLAPLLEWVQYDDRNPAAVQLQPGSLGWHNAYLLGLCGLGLVAALLREPGRRLGLLVAGVVLTGATVAAAALALP